MINDFSTRTGVSVEDILGRSRTAPTVAVRQLYWMFLKDYAGFSYNQIGNMCDRSHATIMHGIAMAREKIEIRDKMTCELWDLVKDVDSRGMEITDRELIKTMQAIEEEYQNVIFCPKCKKPLTGLHIKSGCFQGFVRTIAERQLNGKNKPINKQ